MTKFCKQVLSVPSKSVNGTDSGVLHPVNGFGCSGSFGKRFQQLEDKKIDCAARILCDAGKRPESKEDNTGCHIQTMMPKHPILGSCLSVLSSQQGPSPGIDRISRNHPQHLFQPDLFFSPFSDPFHDDWEFW
jgi:hypothetical protein